jgi:hypothetical protein
MEYETQTITYRDIGLTNLEFPHLPVHHDPEFQTYTYGHIVRGFGDNKLWELESNDFLFYYSTLDLLPHKKEWGTYIIGYFIINCVVDTRKMAVEEIKGLEIFQNNAHIKRKNPKVDLLVKGKENSRLFYSAIRLSHPNNNRMLHPGLSNLITTTSGKSIQYSEGLHRWVLYSENPALLNILLSNN